MAKPKIKYVQLEPAAFLSDDDFQMMNDAERGIYCTIIFYMFCNNGRIKNDPKAIKRLCNVTSHFEQKWKSVMSKLYSKGVWLRHRRVDLELKKATVKLQLSVEAGVKGAEKRWGGHKGSHSDPVAKGREIKGNKDIYIRQFDQARKYYPGEKRGLDTEFDYLCKKWKDWRGIIPLLLPAIKAEEARRASLERANKFVPSWKHFKTWLFNRCWEMTVGKTTTPKEDAVAEQKALEKKQQEMRQEYGKYYESQSTEELQKMRKAGHCINHWWLIDEILAKRKEGK